MVGAEILLCETVDHELVLESGGFLGKGFPKTELRMDYLGLTEGETYDLHVFAVGGRGGPVKPGNPRSPPARFAISMATCHMSSMHPAWTPCVLILVAWRSPRLMPP